MSTFKRNATQTFACLLIAASTAVSVSHAQTAPAPADSAAFAKALAAAVPKNTRLVVAEQNEQASIPWKLSGADAGLPYDVTFANFNGGPAVLEALISGAVDAGYIGEAPLPIAIAAGVKDLVAVGLLANPGSPGNYYLVAQPGSGIQSVKGLAGKSVAYPPGTGRHMVLSGILHEHGLTLGDTVKGVQLAGSEVAPTFASRSVDAAIVLGGQYFRLGEPPILADGRGHNWGLNVLVVRRAALDDPAKAPAIADFLRRAVQFNNWQIRHPDDWIKASLVARQGLTFAQGQRLVKESGQGTFYPIDADALQVFQEIADGLHQTGALKTKIDIAPYVDDRFNQIVEQQNAADAITPPALYSPASQNAEPKVSESTSTPTSTSKSTSRPTSSSATPRSHA